MASPEDALTLEEQAVFEQEQGLVEIEAQFHAQEEGLIQMERTFVKRNQTLVSLIGYISDQERSLLARAEAIGPRALGLVQEALAGADGEAGGFDTAIGRPAERQNVLERRRELLAARMELVEEREQVYHSRLEAIEHAETHFGGFEDKLLARERVIADTLRKLITAAGELAEDEVDEGDDDEEPSESSRGSPGRAGETLELSREAGGQTMTVTRGEVERQGGPGPQASVASATEDAATRRRRGPKGPTNQFKITLEAILGEGEKHAFFRYRADGPEELPGLFLATPNLLKEGREVRLRIRTDEAVITTTGIVSWRRSASDGQGPPGMGIEIASLTEDELVTARDYMSRVPPMVV
jgi:hypothetical protein